MEIDNHIACAMSGLVADARTMVDHARVTSQVSRISIIRGLGAWVLILDELSRIISLHTMNLSRLNRLRKRSVIWR